MESFKKIAEQTMNHIFDFVEKNYDSFDVDFEEENLKIQFDENIFILSIHNPSSQIWLSSPISGAHHFKLIIGYPEVDLSCTVWCTLPCH